MLPGRLVTKGHWGYLTKSSPRRATLHCPVVGPASCRTSGALPGHLEGLRHGAQRAGPATNSVHPDGILRPNSVHASSLGFGNQFFFFFFSNRFPSLCLPNSCSSVLTNLQISTVELRSAFNLSLPGFPQLKDGGTNTSPFTQGDLG